MDDGVGVDGRHSSHRLAVCAQVVQLDGPLFRPSVENVTRFILDHLHKRIFFAERGVDERRNQKRQAALRVVDFTAFPAEKSAFRLMIQRWLLDGR